MSDDSLDRTTERSDRGNRSSSVSRNSRDADRSPSRKEDKVPAKKRKRNYDSGGSDSDERGGSSRRQRRKRSPSPEKKKPAKGRGRGTEAQREAARKAAAARKEKKELLERRLELFQNYWDAIEAEGGEESEGEQAEPAGGTGKGKAKAKAEEPGEDEDLGEEADDSNETTTLRPGDPGYDPGVDEELPEEGNSTQSRQSKQQETGEPPGVSHNRGRGSSTVQVPGIRRVSLGAHGPFHHRVLSRVDANQGRVRVPPRRSRGIVGGNARTPFALQKNFTKLTKERLEQFSGNKPGLRTF